MTSFKKGTQHRERGNVSMEMHSLCYKIFFGEWNHDEGGFVEAKFRKSIDECCCSITKSCATLCDLMGCGTPGSIVFQCFLEFAQIHVHLVSDTIYIYICHVYMCVCVCIKDEYTYIYIWLCVLSHLSRVWFCATLWTAACQAPLSMGFSRQEFWSGLPFPSPGDLLDPGMDYASPVSTCIGKWILYHWCHLGSLHIYTCECT